MKKIMRRKIIVILLFLSFIAFFARTIPQTSLVERAIAIGLGIDFNNNEYTVSVQIVKPCCSQEKGNVYSIVYATDETLGKAIDKISLKLGLVVSLSQCNTFIMGKGVVAAQVFPAINYLISTWQIPEQAVIVATDQTALDILRTKLILCSSSSELIKINSYSEKEYIGILTTNIKDFILQYNSKGKVSTVSYITKQPVSGEDINESTGEDIVYEELDFTKSVAFVEGRPAFILTKDDTFSINIITKKVKNGSLNIKYKEGIFNVNITSSKVNKKVIIEGDKAKLEIEVKLKFKVNEVEYINDYFSTLDITDEILLNLENQIEELVVDKLMKTFEKSKTESIDFYNLYETIYTRQGLKWKSIARDDYLNQVDFKIISDIEVVRS